MRKLSLVALALGAIFALGSCKAQSKKITVVNPLDIDRIGELVSVEIEGTEKEPAYVAGYELLDENGAPQVYDVIRSADDPNSATILFQANVMANSQVTYTWKRGKNDVQTFTPIVSAATHPERYNDFAWENDRIAFRLYHQALIPIDGPSNGVDVFAKRTEELILPDFFKSGDYHKDHGKGVDFYKVGRSLGAGVMAPILNGEIVFGDNYDGEATIIESGNLRVKFSVSYKPLQVGEHLVTETRTYTLEAGSQMNKVEVEFAGLPAGSEVAAGIVARIEGCPNMAKSDHWAAVRDLADTVNGTLFIGVLNPEKWDKVECSGIHVLAYTTLDENQKATFYQGAGWTKWGFDSFELWQQYLNNFQRRLENPLQVTIE